MERPTKIIRVRDIPKGRGTDRPAQSTIYKMHSLRKFPRLIYTVPGAGLVFDLGEWERLCEEAKQASEDRAALVLRTLVEG